MNEVFETDEKIYNLLGYLECGLVLGKNLYLPNIKRGNINTLVLAGPGAGKSASYCIPNIMQKLGSYITIDPDGEIYDMTNAYLRRNGYEVILIDVKDMQNTYNYNPLSHINTDKDIELLINNIIKNENDEFWLQTSKCLLRCVIKYVLEKEETKDLLQCFNVLSNSREVFFNKIQNCANENILNNFNVLKVLPEKTYQSIVSTVMAKLSFIINIQNKNRTYNYQVDFKELSKRKIAFFIKIDDDCKEYNKIAEIFISQSFSQIEKGSENIYYLLDEINLLDRIGDFAQIMKSARRKGASISVIIDSINKIKSIYGEDFETIIGNCDTQMFLGSNLLSDIEYFAQMLDVDKNTVRELDGDSLLVYERGLKPIKAQKMYFFNNETWIKEIEGV